MGVPRAMLPTIKASSEVYGKAVGALAGVPVAGDLGDQQAALFGQTCFSAGEAKNTYGTGCFMLLNTGTKPVQSKNGLLTTLGYKIGGQPAVYCLEGSIAITGALVQWLRDNLGMIQKSADVEALANTVEDNGGIYFVPAFSGLFAPYWKSDARGVIVGLTRYVNKGHIARAVLEATAYQTREVLDAMNADSGVESDRPQGGRRHGLQQHPDAVPGRHPGRARHPPEGCGNHRPRRGLCGRPGGRLLERRWKTCAPTGARTRTGRPRWTPASARSSTRAGRRPSPAPSTGSSTTSDWNTRVSCPCAGSDREPAQDGTGPSALSGIRTRQGSTAELQARRTTIHRHKPGTAARHN